MIERTNISGRPATVAYITDDFKPADKSSAQLAKIVFDDGNVVFLNLKKPTADAQSGVRSARRG